MRAMLLTAGLGTRLRPLTLERAKPAIPLLGKPIVVRLIEQLSLLGISEFRLNLHYLPRSIEKLFECVPYSKYHVSFSFEPHILGTAGGLKANEEFFQDETFIMANGDIVFDFDLREALLFHRKNGALATLILLPQTQPHQFYPVYIDNQGRLIHFKQKHIVLSEDEQAYVFTGIHILEPQIFKYIPPRVFWEMNDTVYPRVIREGKLVQGFAVEGYWNDVGNPSRYLAAHRHLLSSSLRQRNFRDNVNVVIEEGALVGTRLWAERGCVFEYGSCSDNSIFWENVTVKKGSNITGCIVGSSVVVQGVHSNCVLTRNGSISIE